MKLLLLRHGQTEATRLHCYCGSTDVPLSEEGRAALSGVTVPPMIHYYTSGMRRANETMELLCPGISYDEIPALREMDFGVFEMKTYEMLRDDPDYQTWITGDNEHNICPGGESGAAALERAMTALQELIAKGEDTVVVSHGGVVAGAMNAWFPGTGKSRYQWQSRPGHGYLVEFAGDCPVDYREFPEK